MTETVAVHAATPPRSLHSVLPSLAGLAGCIVLAIVNELRDFELWRNYALTGLAEGSIIAWILWRWNAQIPHYIQWVITVAAMLHYGGGSLGSPNPFHMGLFGFHGINGAYHTYDWWDHLTHGVGVGASTMALGYLFEIYQMRRGLAWGAGAVWLLAVVVGLTVGVGVELAEYLGKEAFNTIDQGGYENTIRDLHFNIYGAAIGGGLAAFVERRRLAKRIEQAWGRPAKDLQGAPWTTRVPPAMAGVIAFAAPAAGMTLFLSLRFLVTPLPANDLSAYDDALQALLASVMLGIVACPVAVLLWRTRTRKGATA